MDENVYLIQFISQTSSGTPGFFALKIVDNVFAQEKSCLNV